MDLRNTPDGAIAESGDWEDLRDAAADQMTSTAKHALDGCIFGLSPTSAQTHVQIGEAYIDGNRLRLRANEAIDIAGLTRPTGSMVAWVAVLASYTTKTSGTVTDDAGVQYVRITNDSIIITLSRGVDAATKAAAVKPSIPTGSIVLCDILLDASTAVGSLTGDPARRPQCPDDELRTESDLQWDAIRALQETQAASLQSPNKGPTPTATSTVALRVDATWSAGTVDTGVPAITKAKFRWRQAGENWADSRTVSLANVQARNFSVPNGDTDVQMQVAAGNSNGFGAWSDTGTIDAADIEPPPALMTRTFTANQDFVWPYPQSQRARVTLTGGAGGGGAGGGGAGGQAAVNPRGVGGAGGGGAAGGAVGEDGADATGRNGGGGGGSSIFGTVVSGAGGDAVDATGGDGFISGHFGTYGGGGAGGGVAGGDGGDAGVTGVNSSTRGGGGGGGGQAGADGDETTVEASTRSIDLSSAGGAGGGGGGGGAGGHGSQADVGIGEDGADAVNRTGGGAGGIGGDNGADSGGRTEGDGGAGGIGAGGQVAIADVSGLQVGDTFTIVIGDGGASGVSGRGGVAAGTSTDGGDGGAGVAGGDGEVTIEPLTG